MEVRKKIDLISKQKIFSEMVARLILEAIARGYEVTLGEVWRSPATAKVNAANGVGIVRSLHCDRLAIDLNLFKNGVLLTKTKDYRELGEWWEAQSNGDLRFAWGGRFDDGGHFSCSHFGRQ